MTNIVSITPEQNALDSLRRAAHELEHGKKEISDPLKLKGVISWGWHTVGLLTYLRLRPGRQSFDAWVQDYLHEGSPELNVERDARWEERERLSFLEILDILSEKESPILKPEFYQGWQDRTSRCQWLREQAHQLIGYSLSEKEREPLLFLLAVYHRLIRLPAGINLNAEEIFRSLGSLFDLIEKLIDEKWKEAEELHKAVERCRQFI